MKVCRGLHLYPVTCCRIFPATKYRLFRVDQTPEQNGTASVPATQVLFETQTWMTTGMGGRVLRTAGKAFGPGGSPRFDPENEPGPSSLGSTSSSWGSFSSAGSASPIPSGTHGPLPGPRRRTDPGPGSVPGECQHVPQVRNRSTYPGPSSSTNWRLCQCSN